MRFKLYIFYLLLLGCAKSKSNYPTKLIGHGGNGFEIQSSFYHDNTQEAIDIALNLKGVDGVELDLRLAKDGTGWLYHDDVLENETNGSGCIETQLSESLVQVEYSTLSKEKLLKLSDLDYSLYKGKVLLLDVRHYNPCEQKGVDFSMVLNEINSFKNRYPEVELMLNCKVSSAANYFATNGLFVFIELKSISDFKTNLSDLENVYGIMINNLDVEKEEIVEFRKEYNKKVVIFGPRSPKFIRKALNKQPDYLMTDDLRTAIIEKN